MYDRNTLHDLVVDQNDRGEFYLAWPDGSRFFPDTYKRAQDAKRARTMLLKKVGIHE